jgi:hypothetical protein
MCGRGLSGDYCVRTVELLSETNAHFAGSTGADQNTIGGDLLPLAELQPDHAAVVASGVKFLTYRKLQNLIGEMRVALRQRASNTF